MTGSWLARPSPSLVLVEVHRQEHRDGEEDGEDRVEGIGDAERSKIDLYQFRILTVSKRWSIGCVKTPPELVRADSPF